jgi:hypothetical protein
MKLKTFYYSLKDGWSVEALPDLDSEQTLVMVFASPETIKDPSPLQHLAQHYPNSKIIGCSSAGEILGPHVSDHTLSVASIKFEKTQLQIVQTVVGKAEDSFAAGKQIADKLKGDDLKGIIVLSDGLLVNGSELVKGLNTLDDKRVIITGGLAGDGDRFTKTWTIFNGKIVENSIVAVGFYGDAIQIGFSSQGGWDIFGPERRITRSKNNILYELDGRPALALYKEYLGERAKELPASGLLFPLAIRHDLSDTKHLVRTILGVDEKEQSLIFAGDVPTGYLAQLMKANFDRLIASAGETSKRALNKMKISKNEPLLAIAISCVGRRLLLGERIEEETQTTLEGLPEKTQQIGFYSYGELSPHVVGTCDLHNQTMTLTTLSEE